MTLRNWAVPDIMVALAAPHKITVILTQNFPNPFLIFSHYNDNLSRRSDRKVKVSGVWEWFNERSSGTANRTRSNKASNEPHSKTRPGTSSLVAIQTSAS